MDISEILGTLELDGEFVSPTGGRISFSENKTITVEGYVRDDNGEWSNTEHTGNLTIKNNKIVSDSITVNYVYYSDAEGYSNETESRKYEITINPEDPTTLLVTNTNKRIGGDYMEYTNTNVYIPVEKTRPNFDGTWTLGDNKLILKNGNFAIVDNTQVLYSGDIWYMTDVKNNIYCKYYISDTDYESIEGYLARSGKFYMRISKTYETEYFVSTKLSDSVDVDIDIENPLIGKYKDFDGRTIEITDSSVTLNGEIFIWIDDETSYRVKNPSIDYTFSFMDFNSDWIDLGEKETTFEKIKWNSENGEYDVIGTETYLKGYTLHIDGDRVSFYVDFGDEGHGYGVGCVKYKAGPVDFTGTWVLSEKIYDNEEFSDAQITINSDGTFSVFVDGKEIVTPLNGVVDLETANSENCIAIWELEAIITESGKLYAEFCYKYDAESDQSWWATAFFTKQ